MGNVPQITVRQALKYLLVLLAMVATSKSDAYVKTRLAAMPNEDLVVFIALLKAEIAKRAQTDDPET